MKTYWFSMIAVALLTQTVQADPRGRTRPSLPAAPRPTMSRPSMPGPAAPRSLVSRSFTGGPAASSMPSATTFPRSITGASVLPNSTGFNNPIHNIYDPYGYNRQAAYNIELYGAAWGTWKPYLLGYNPYVHWVNYGPVFPIQE